MAKAPAPIPRPNPFRIHGLVEGEYFTDREAEIRRFTQVLREPAAKLLVAGPRRMGKSSTLARAVADVNAEGGHAFVADLSTASTITDMANRVLAAAGKVLGRRWGDFVGDFVRRFQAGVKLGYDPATGMALPSLEVGLRTEPLAKQQESLASVLDLLDTMAEERGVTLGIVLDEFQEIARFGGTGAGAGERTPGRVMGRRRRAPRSEAGSRIEQPEWHLRGVIQRHQHVSYILAGSKPSLIQAMADRGGAFYKLLDPMPFKPIGASHIITWIDERLRHVGRASQGAGARCVEWAGPRTRDIVRLARKCVDLTAEGVAVDDAVVTAAFREILDEEDETNRAWWDELTTPQQNVLRAVVAQSAGLTTREVRRAFSLENSGAISNRLKAFVLDGDLVQSTYGSRYAFDDPFMRGWVILHALPDIGIRDKPITYVATPTKEYD